MLQNKKKTDMVHNKLQDLVNKWSIVLNQINKELELFRSNENLDSLQLFPLNQQENGFVMNELLFNFEPVYPNESLGLFLIASSVTAVLHNIIAEKPILLVSEASSSSEQTRQLFLERYTHISINETRSFDDAKRPIERRFMAINLPQLQVSTNTHLLQLLFTIHSLALKQCTSNISLIGFEKVQEHTPLKLVGIGPLYNDIQLSSICVDAELLSDKSVYSALTSVAKSCRDASCWSRFDLIGDWDNEKSSMCKLSMHCDWTADAPALLSAPEEQKNVKFTGLISSSHIDRDNFTSIESLRKRLAAVYIWNALLPIESDDPLSIASVEFASLSKNFESEDTNQRPRGVALLDGFLEAGVTNIGSNLATSLTAKERTNLDFSEQLFHFVAENCIDLIDVTECLAIVVDDLENDHLSPFISRSNKTMIGAFLKDAIKMPDIETASSKLDALLQQPLQYLVELGIFSLHEDLIFYLTQNNWITRLQLDAAFAKLGDSSGFKERLLLIRIMYRLVEIGTFFKINIPLVPAAILQSVLQATFHRLMCISSCSETQSENLLQAAATEIGQLGNDSLDSSLSVSFELPKFLLSTQKTVNAITKSILPNVWGLYSKNDFQSITLSKHKLWSNNGTDSLSNSDYFAFCAGDADVPIHI